MTSIINSENGNNGGATAGMPWWVRAITVFGVPAAIALFLVWTMASKQTAALETIATGLADHNRGDATATADIRAAATEVRDVLRDTNIRMESYLRIMCVNAAKNVTDRSTCLSVR
jgi:hypothetical protein